MLIECGADPNATLLFKALEDNKSDTAKILIECGANIHAMDKAGMTPLHYAILTNESDAANELINRGANIHAKDKLGWTPIHCAILSNNLDVAKKLIAKGADINAVDNNGKSPLAMSKSEEMTELLRTRSMSKVKPPVAPRTKPPITDELKQQAAELGRTICRAPESHEREVPITKKPQPGLIF